MWHKILNNAVVHVVLIAATVFALLGCVDAVVKRFEVEATGALVTLQK